MYYTKKPPHFIATAHSILNTLDSRGVFGSANNTTCILCRGFCTLVLFITVDPLNNGHVGEECYVHYSEVVPSLEVLTCTQLLAGGKQFVCCRRLSALRSVVPL